MPILTISAQTGDHRIPFVPGKSLLEILRGANMPIRSGCAAVQGLAACVRCVLKLDMAIPPHLLSSSNYPQK